MTEVAPQDGLATVPALLARNVKRHGKKPAYREKEYGIWQSWTWAQAADEIDALAQGLLTLGAQTGDYIAISGRNRPALYWSMGPHNLLVAYPFLSTPMPQQMKPPMP